jgi:hypothetical protein
MPLPPSVPREELHQRRIDLQGFERVDGLFDIEARIIDTKPYELTIGDNRVVPPGEHIHDMTIRLVIDENLNVVDVAACTDASPYGICLEAASALQSLKGLSISRGWSKAIRERFEGRKGCTHLTELLKPLATVAYQSLLKVRRARPPAVDATGKPVKINSCFAYASDREVVRVHWPEYFDGTAEK